MPRLSSPNGHSQRPQGAESPAHQGAQTIGGIARFGRDKRLLRRREFDAVFQHPSVRVTVPPLWAAARPSGGNSARLGLVVRKKVLRRAVDRNRAKRTIRESFRLAQGLPPVDIVVRVMSPNPRNRAPFRVTIADAERLFRVLRLRLSKRQGAPLAG